WNYTGSFVVEINKTSGDVYTRGSLAEFQYFVAGSSSFDQNSGSMLLLGIDTNNVLKMIIFDTYSNTYQAGFVPGNVSEIVCDNSAFARNAYTTTAVQEAESIEIKLYPNPAADKITLLNLPASASEIQITILNATGQGVINRTYKSLQQLELNVSALKPGNYFLQIKTNASVETRKLVII
ncbi:MAG: T9SS type A sorting domain-containing protein, partial [Lentimicrobium sp.]|nr:T9SS type A sorting domain-containing protein [Lentimicrobium sp.]